MRLGEWSDYFLAPYACYNCAPFGVDPTDATVTTKSAKSKNSPGKGLLVELPKTKKVLGG